MAQPKRRSKAPVKRKVVRSHKRTTIASASSASKKAAAKRAPPEEMTVLVKFVRATARFWHRDSFRYLAPQGVPTTASRMAAAKSSILNQLASSIEAEEHLDIELWDDEIDDD